MAFSWNSRLFRQGSNVELYMHRTFYPFESTQIIDVPSTLRRGIFFFFLKMEVSLWKRIKCFPSTLRRRNLKTRQWPVIVRFQFERFRFQNVFRPHENEKPAFSNSFGSKSVFEKLHCRSESVWTVGLTVETKLLFQIVRRCTDAAKFDSLSRRRSC